MKGSCVLDLLKNCSFGFPCNTKKTMGKYKERDKWRCLSDWIKEQHYNLGIFADCVDSAADERFFHQHEVASCTGWSGDVPVQRWIAPHYTFGLFANCVNSAKI